MAYKTVRVKKLWHGFVSVRDYDLEEAMKNKRGLRIVLGEEFALVPYEDLGKGYINDEVFTSKHKHGQTYRLVDFDWKTYRIKEVQPTMFNWNITDSLAVMPAFD